MQDLKITFIQSILHWENIPDNLRMFDEKINAITEATDLIILPEMFSTGFTMNNKHAAEKTEGTAWNWMKNKAKEKNCVITGSIVAEENGKYFNRLIWMQPDGNYFTYDKRHLFRMANEHEYYTPGTEKIIIELKGWRICPLICYDLRFPVWSRNQFKKQEIRSKSQETTNHELRTTNYDLLIYVANWPERRSHHWKSLLVARSIENQAYVAGINRVGKDGKDISYSGDSVILNAKGEILSRANNIHTEYHETVKLSYSELEEYRKNFPAYMDADSFEIYL